MMSIFSPYTPKTIGWHAAIICQASALDLPIVETRYLSELEAEQYLIYTADSDVLLSTITGVIDRFNQNIVQARIHAANPGLYGFDFYHHQRTRQTGRQNPART